MTAAVVEQVHSVGDPGDGEKLSPMGMTSQVEVIPFFFGFPDAKRFMVHDDIEPGCVAVRYRFRREMDVVVEAGESYARSQFCMVTAQEVTEGKGLFLFFYIAVKKVMVAKDGPDAQRGFKVLQVAVTAVAEDKGQMGVDEVAAEEDGIGPECHDTADEASCVPVALQGPHVDIRKEGQPDRRDCFFRLDHDGADDGVDGLIDAPGHDGEDQEEQYEGKAALVCLPERLISHEKDQKIQYGIDAGTHGGIDGKDKPESPGPGEQFGNGNGDRMDGIVGQRKAEGKHQKGNEGCIRDCCRQGLFIYIPVGQPQHGAETADFPEKDDAVEHEGTPLCGNDSRPGKTV